MKECFPDVWLLNTCGVNQFLLVGNTRALLVDTAYGFFDPHKIIRSITSLPLEVVCTHGHVDHAGGNCFFQKENVYLHPDDLKVCERHTSPEYRQKALQMVRTLQFFLLWKPLYPRGLDQKAYLQRRDDISRYQPLKDGMRFELGNLTAEIIALPGHTAGSVGIWIPERKVVITSDAANPGTWMQQPESTNINTYRKSLRRLEKLDADYLLTGHQTKLYPRTALQDWIAVAENPDWERGKVEKGNFFPAEQEARVCHEKNNPKNKAAITITKDKLC